jgi:hypothetical protein
MRLSEDQENAVNALLDALTHQDEATLVGPAGTGKTTTLRAFVERWQDGGAAAARLNPEPACVCPTWKAALRFTEVTGWKATSIHGMIYGAPEETKDEKGRDTLHFEGVDMEKSGVKKRLIVVDEASMVGTKVYNDLKYYAKQKRCKILFVGDREQLEPVNDEWGVDFDNPTAALTQVHRQADGSNLLDFVTCVREGKMQAFTDYGTDVVHHRGVSEDLMTNFWQSDIPVSEKIVITYTNRLRIGQNNIARRALGKTSRHPMEGEPLMSFGNRAGLVNGEIVMTHTALYEYTKENNPLADAVSAMGLTLMSMLVAPNMSDEACAQAKTIYVIPESLGLFGRRKSEFWKELVSGLVRQSGGELFNKWGRLNERNPRQTSPRNLKLIRRYAQLADVDYGYACTAHKSQGSQWDNVFVLFEPTFRKVTAGPAERRRWTYTACTRAAKSLSLGSL